jgi:transporter family-2 protein
MMRILLLLLPITAGVASSTQAATNAVLTARLGLGAALLVNLAGTLAIVLPMLGVVGLPPTFTPAGTSWTHYVGGVYGFVIMASLAVAFPRLGGAWSIALLVLGQGVSALVIDHYGLLGQPRDPMTMVRLVGLALIVCGVLVLRWRG